MMLRPMVLMLLLLWVAVFARGAEAKSKPAEDGLNEHLAMPGSAMVGNWRALDRIAHLDVLRALSGTSNALATVKAALPSITNGWQRAEFG